jgi:hypothetical protein
MRIARLLPLLVASLAAGCTAAPADDVDATESAVAVAHASGTCGYPAPSPDGAYVVVHQCSSGSGSTSPRSIVRMSVAGGPARMRTIGRYTEADEVTSYGAGPGFAWYVTKHASGAWDVTVRDLALAQPARTIVPAFPEGASAAQVARLPRGSDVIATAEGRHLVFTSGSGDQFLFAIDLAAPIPSAVAIDLGASSYGRELWPSPDGKRLLVADLKNGYVERFRTLDLGGEAPVLGEPVAVALKSPSSLRGSYDGQSYIASGRRPTDATGTVIAAIDTATGAAKVLSENIDGVMWIASRGAHAWYNARRWDHSVDPPATSHVVERVTRDGSSVVRTLLRRASSTRARLSADGTTLLVVSGYSSQPKELAAVASDGTSPARVIRTGARFEFRRTAGATHLAVEKDPQTGAELTTLVDDVTGSIRESYPGYVDGAALSADGRTLYAVETCQVGTIAGAEIRRLSGGGEVLVPCSIGSYVPTLIPIPQSSAVLSVRTQATTEDEGALKQVLLLEP